MESLWKIDKHIICHKNPEIQTEIEQDYIKLSTTEFIDKWLSFFPEVSQTKMMCIRLDRAIASTVFTTLFAKRWKNKVLN